MSRAFQLVCGAAVVATWVAVPMASPVAASSALQPGFYVTGGTTGVPSSDIFQAPGFVIDRQGGEHLLLPRGGRRSLVTLYTRHPGSSKWMARRSPSLALSAAAYQDNQANEDTRISTGITTDRRRQYAVVTDCKGVYVSTASAVSATFGTFHKVLSEPAGVCKYKIDDDGPLAGKPQHYRLITTVALPGSRIAALFELPASQSRSYEVAVGRPGHAFHAMAGVQLPPGQVESMTRDARTGELFLASDGGEAAAGGASTSTDNNSVFVTSKKPGHGWSAPTEIASGRSSTARTAGYLIASLAAVGGRVQVAMEHFSKVGNGTDTYGGIFVSSRSTAGHWSPPRRLPDTTTRDSHILLIADRSTGRFDSVFARYFKNRAANYTIETDTLDHGTWTKPTAMTSGDDSVPVAIALTAVGTPAVAYTKYAKG